MGALSTRALRRMIRDTGARAGRRAARELELSLEEIAWDLAERGRLLVEHAGRLTVKDKDIRMALKEWKRHEK
jgi:histone H3/H4